jgi:hypothetical protein
MMLQLPSFTGAARKNTRYWHDTGTVLSILPALGSSSTTWCILGKYCHIDGQTSHYLVLPSSQEKEGLYEAPSRWLLSYSCWLNRMWAAGGTQCCHVTRRLRLAAPGMHTCTTYLGPPKDHGPWTMDHGPWDKTLYMVMQVRKAGSHQLTMAWLSSRHRFEGLFFSQ